MRTLALLALLAAPACWAAELLDTTHTQTACCKTFTSPCDVSACTGSITTSGLTSGSTLITSGSDKSICYDNAGVLDCDDSFAIDESTKQLSLPSGAVGPSLIVGSGTTSGFGFNSGSPALFRSGVPNLTVDASLATIATDTKLTNQHTLLLNELTANGANTIGIRAPAAVTSDVVCTLEDDATPFDSCVTAGAGAAPIDATYLTATANATLTNEVVLTPTDDNIAVANGTTWQIKAVGDCQDTAGKHLNYTASTNTVSCGTTNSGGNNAVFFGNAGVPSSTVFMGIRTASATENDIAMPVPFSGTASNLYCKTVTAPGAGTSWAITVRKAGADTAITCTIADTATTCNDTVNTAAFTAGDLESIKAVETGATSEAALNCTFKMS
jgi:hypothetical protein